MIESYLAWARGPLFVFSFSVLILGIVRLIVLTDISVVRLIYEASDKKLPVKALIAATLKWLFPFKQVPGQPKNRPWYSIVSILFHIGLILTPVFLGAHILLWKSGIGISWAAMPNNVEDVLALFTIAVGLVLIFGRVVNVFSRSLSKFQDFSLPPLLLVPFISGFLAMHPALDPVSYNLMMLFHVLSADLIFILIPFTKMSHFVLLPTSQLISELGWHFPADMGEKVAVALHKETERI
ncbi:MAG: respiratory nitrate reductase subunit gamma [Deltaproteobacteria bacterium]|nr:respiratory nitrate reductase subunit gamma [Deltaproteobacteria bacterium]MCL5276713.1 respiratory nitrate reductase subunit gamma [Deltaproteobacteria bacterium]